AELVRERRPGIALNEHRGGDGDIVYQHACKLGCEVIVSQRLGLLYRPESQESNRAGSEA
ncbi:MAG TPA: hypothetical protein VGJ20_39090, partial [Xanthobacteraceae bacterium]